MVFGYLNWIYNVFVALDREARGAHCLSIIKDKLKITYHKTINLKIKAFDDISN